MGSSSHIVFLMGSEDEHFLDEEARVPFLNVLTRYNILSYFITGISRDNTMDDNFM